VGEIYAREFRALGFETRWVDVPAEMKRAGHLVATHRGKRGGHRLLLIGHLDTVLQGEPFRRDGNRAYGSGSSDMKGGNLVAHVRMDGAWIGSIDISIMFGDN